MTRLVFGVISIRQENGLEFIERYFAIGLWVVDFWRRSGWHELRVVMCLVVNRNRRLAEQDILLNKRERTAYPETEFMEARAKVTRFMQLFMEVGLFESLAVVC